MVERILHLHFGTDGGAERFLVVLAQAFGRRGLDQHFVIRPGRRWRPAIEPLGPIWENPYRYLSLSAPLLGLRVGQLCRRWRPDGILAWMPRAARLMPAHPGAVKLCRLGDYPRHLRHFRNCDALVGIQPDIGRHCQALGWGRPMLTISNFVAPQEVTPISRASLDTPEDAFVVAGVGRLVERKAFDVLLRAAAQLDGAYVWLLGEGEAEGDLRQLAAELGIAERVRFLGWRKDPDPIHYVAAADAYGMPSRIEALGNVLLEAWRAETPVVSSRSEGPGWAIEHGKTGLLFDIDDADAMAGHLRALQADPARRAAIAAAARARLEADFTEGPIVDQYLRAFSGSL